MGANTHGEWLVFPDDGVGQDLSSFEQCSYCGSITPEKFLELLAKADTKAEIADLKYGYPHKVYLDIRNPNPDGVRITGGKTGPDITEDTPDSVWRCYAHGSAECKCPKERGVTGNWQILFFGKFPRLNVKFYLEHLIADWPEWQTSLPLLRDQLGLNFFYDTEGRLMFKYERVR